MAGQPKRRTPVGSPLPLSDADLDAEAAAGAISRPSDLRADAAFWDAHCPPSLRGLLAATVEEPSA
jgi:hypothetical protein